MKQRSNDPEIIDLGQHAYTSQEYEQCLKTLGQLGQYTGSDALTLRALKRLDCNPTSIIDVGCGGGSFAAQLAQAFPQASIVGLDINAQAIAYAQKNYQKPNLRFVLSNQPELNELPKSYDIVTATLVCHHLDDATLVDFLKRASMVAKKAIVINDLQRSRLAYLGFKALSKLFSFNRLVDHDGALSILKSFTYTDWVRYLKLAKLDSLPNAITWHWLFRWIVVVELI